jgi:formylglycine-generating enzyme required for sulfatase activity
VNTHGRQEKNHRDPRTQRKTPEIDGFFGVAGRRRRGSAWCDDGWASRSAFRQRYEPERRADHIGFRVVAVQR